MHRHSPLMRSLFSQSQTPTAPRRAVGFFRSGCPSGCPAWLITQFTSGQLFYLLSLSTVDGSYLNRAFINVNANYWCSRVRQTCEKLRVQAIGKLTLSNLKNQFVPVLHRKLHSDKNREKVTREPRITLTRKIYGSMVNLTVTNHAVTIRSHEIRSHESRGEG